MSAISPPTFDEWVEYSFTQGHADFEACSAAGEPDAAMERAARFVDDLPAELLARYVLRLFEDPVWVGQRYNERQIAEWIWYFFGIATQTLRTLYEAPLEQDLQIRCVHSVATVYTDLFDSLCCDRGRRPDECFIQHRDLDIAVGMIWDMDGGLEYPLFQPQDRPQLFEPTFGVLAHILDRCRTSTCRYSALHGLGHLVCFHRHKDEQIALRCVGLIDCFLAREGIPDWLADYARVARRGDVL